MPDAFDRRGIRTLGDHGIAGACTPLFPLQAGFVGIPESNVDLKIVDQETGTKEMEANGRGRSLSRPTA